MLPAAAMQFQRQDIKIDKVSLNVELAVSEAQIRRGLMFRSSVSGGMLFIFEDEKPRNFWMKNTFIPLSIGFFNEKKILIDIQDMEPSTSKDQLKVPTYQSRGPAMFVLEVQKGWFQDHNIKLGARLHLTPQTKVQAKPKPSLGK